jgi:hypothetical protein
VLERTYDDLSMYDVKVIMGDVNAKIRREDMLNQLQANKASTK